MENASQALLIAGGILLAILVITLLVIGINNASKMANSQQSVKDAERLSAWNAEWESYNRTRLYGMQVLTVINKAEQNNSDYNNEEEYKVSIEVKIDGTTYTGATLKEAIMNNKNNIFECTNIGYNQKTGRVNKMEFKKIADTSDDAS